MGRVCLLVVLAVLRPRLPIYALRSYTMALSDVELARSSASLKHSVSTRPGYGGPLAFTGRASGLRHHNSAHERRPTIAHRRLTSTNTVITGWPEPTSAAEDGSCPRSRYRMRPNRSAQRPPRPSSPRYCSNIAAAGTVVTVHCVLPAHLPTRRHPIPRSTPTADAEPAKTGTEIEVEQHPSDFRPEGVPSVSISGHPMAAAPDRYHHLVMAPSMCPSCGVMERT